MSVIVRSLVSNDRVRYIDDKVDLDLTYITETILAMAFPASGLEKLWRNSISAVCELLNEKHQHSFMVWNLSETSYSPDQFDNQIVHTPFADHHPPPLERYFELVRMIDSWLSADPYNVSVVHCVGGKGRTGTIIVGVIFYRGLFETMEECVDYFAAKRSHLKKGIEQPSQLRWAQYFERLMNFEAINRQPVSLQKILVNGFPQGTKYLVEIWSSPFQGSKLYSTIFDQTHKAPILILDINLSNLRNDIYIVFYQRRTVPVSVEVKLFHVCFHTFFIKEKHVVIQKGDIDHVDRNFQKSLTDEFRLGITFSRKEDATDLVDIPEFMIQMVEKYHERKRMPKSPTPKEQDTKSQLPNEKANLANSELFKRLISSQGLAFSEENALNTMNDLPSLPRPSIPNSRVRPRPQQFTAIDPTNSRPEKQIPSPNIPVSPVSKSSTSPPTPPPRTPCSRSQSSPDHAKVIHKSPLFPSPRPLNPVSPKKIQIIPLNQSSEAKSPATHKLTNSEHHFLPKNTPKEETEAKRPLPQIPNQNIQNNIENKVRIGELIDMWSQKKMN